MVYLIAILQYDVFGAHTYDRVTFDRVLLAELPLAESL